MGIPGAFVGLVDDAAIFPPGDVPLDQALAAHLARRDEWYAGLVGSFVVSDVDVPDLPRADGPPLDLSVVVTGGAGAVPGALRLVARSGHRLAGVETALRDLDDLAGNARRVVAAVDAARSEGILEHEVPVYVELPHVGSTASWLAAADEVAAAELRLKLRTGGLAPEAHPHAHALARWIDAALDRETPFKCTAGLHHAVRRTSDEGFEQHGFLNVLVATRHLFDGHGTDHAVAVLEQRDPGALHADWAELDDAARAGARRWFTSFGSCSVREPLDDLTTLGLLKEPQ